MTARDDNPALHRVVVERERGTDPIVRFECLGDATAPCHQWPACSCEEWSEASHHADAERTIPAPGHEDIPQDKCWMDPWFNATTSGDPIEFAELYHGDLDADPYGDLAWLISGPVSATFEGDYMSWEYAPAREGGTQS